MGSQAPVQNSKPELSKLSITDFRYVRVIGNGSFGKVYLATEKSTRRKVAIKELQKARVLWMRQVKNVMNQLAILSDCRNSFIVNAEAAMQDRHCLYLLMDYCYFGDLRYQYTQKLALVEEQLKFLAAGVVLGLEYLHSNGIIHHDIKPQNIVFDQRLYPKITDFGVANYWRPQNAEDCFGSLGYMAPELVLKGNHGISVDYFSLGVILYEAVVGLRPYTGDTRTEMKNNMLASQVELKGQKATGYSENCVQFINKLIQRKPQNRLGFNGPAEVMQHPWLRKFQFQKMREGELKSPLKLNEVDERKSVSMRAVPDQFKTMIIRKKELKDIFEGYKLVRK